MDYASIVSDAIDAVDKVKDPDLKRIAFEKILDLLLHSGPQQGASKRLTPKKGSPKPAAGPAKKPAGKRGAGRSKYSEAKVREVVKTLNLTATQKGLPEFSQMKSARLQGLWILCAARANRIDNLTSHEIAYLLLNRLRTKSEYRTIHTALDRVVKSGEVQRVDDVDGMGAGYSLLAKGEQCVTNPTPAKAGKK